MFTYLISYDLDNSDQDYGKVFEAIKRASNGIWWHYLNSTWIIKTSFTVTEVANSIQAEIDEEDHLLVIEVKNNKQGWLKRDAWETLNQNMFD